MYYQWAPYVPVAERRRQAAAEMAKLTKKGHAISPVRIEGRAIATTVWGKAWCTNLEAYSDYANRLPRGRTYVRNGSVVDLQIAPGRIEARVSGSSIYRITVTVTALPKPRWNALVTDCAGGIDSLVELLQGRFSKGVMERLCRQSDGLFPTPKEIKLDCSCPDGAYMCKHLAAVLYGIGARLDQQPELLFILRQVAATDLLAKAGAGLAANATPPASERTLAADDVSALFGLEMDQDVPAPTTVKKPPVVKKSAPSVHTARVKAKPASRPTRDPSSRLLNLLRKRGSIDNAAARAITGLDAAGVRPLLQRLVADGHARVEGQKRGTRYLAT
jgi:uncharacterized Zn finger protein